MRPIQWRYDLGFPAERNDYKKHQDQPEGLHQERDQGYHWLHQIRRGIQAD